VKRTSFVKKKSIALDLAASYCRVTVANAAGECMTVPDSPSLAFSNQAAILAGLGGIVCFLLTHEILSTRQYMLAGLKNVRDTERSEHAAIRPVAPFPYPPHLLKTL